jgi:hypothetical protein
MLETNVSIATVFSIMRCSRSRIEEKKSKDVYNTGFTAYEIVSIIMYASVLQSVIENPHQVWFILYVICIRLNIKKTRMYEITFASAFYFGRLRKIEIAKNMSKLVKPSI